MTLRISLICAPPHQNPGMYSVDLAFGAFLERSGLDATFQLFCYGGPLRADGMTRHELDYRSLADNFDEVVAADLILFWGDFHHAYSYWRNALRNGPHQMPVFPDDQAETAYMAKYLLLAGQPPEVFSRTLSFGTSLIGDDLRSLTTVDSAYREAFPAFVAGVRRIWFRDPISAAHVSVVRGDRAHSTLGVDCAHLLTAEDYRAIAGPLPAAGDYAGIFFGRVDEHATEPALLAGRLAKGAGLDPVWIPWLGPSPDAVAVARSAVPDLETAAASASFERLIALVAGARLIVTDTYHLCLIAWRLGVPAICIGRGAQRAVRPVSDKKKEIFYLTQSASALYLFHEQVADPSNHPAIVHELVALVRDRAYVDAVVDSLDAQSAIASAELAATIEAGLS